MANRLDGKIALITGGCSGIGLGTVELFLAEGAQVVVADIQHEKGLALEARYPGKLRFAPCDVLREADIAAAADLAVQAFGGLDILFNNAGAGGSPKSIEEMDEQGWDFTMALLVRSTMFGIKHAAAKLRARGGGAIINTASIAGTRPGMGAPAYGVAKAAVVHLTQMAATELAGDRIRVNCISPGIIATPIFGAPLGLGREEADAMAARLPQHMSNIQPIPKGGEPQDIAKACLFFASDDSPFVTGVNMVVDGGLLVQSQINVDPAAPNSLFHALGLAGVAVPH